MALSFLDAQNIMLVNNGEDPISNIANVKDSQYAKTKDILTRITQEELMKGYGFSTQEKTLVVDDNNQIPVPDDILNMWFPVSLAGRVTVRDGILWDKQEDAAYANNLKVLIYMNMSFDSMPFQFRNYVAYEAACQYISAYGSGMGSPQWANVKERRNVAWITAQNSEYSRIPDAARFYLIYNWMGNSGAI